jgi:hypothetical protein
MMIFSRKTVGVRLMATRQDREELTPVESRQGFLDRPVLTILVVSTALVAVLFALLWVGFF